MSKAFLRESDLADEPVVPNPIAPLPPGAKNLLTTRGADRLRDELSRLTDIERPPLAAQSASDPDLKRDLQVLDQRIRYLRESLRTATIVDPPGHSDGVARFGSTITVRDTQGELARYRIVGVDETDLEQGCISWLSPLARALVNARNGTSVSFSTPAGPSTLEVVAVD
ncbi:MAG: GreA/GreB family elongation factor [Opitutus sp.]